MLRDTDAHGEGDSKLPFLRLDSNHTVLGGEEPNVEGSKIGSAWCIQSSLEGVARFCISQDSSRLVGVKLRNTVASTKRSTCGNE